jgi:hypothetical protein
MGRVATKAQRLQRMEGQTSALYANPEATTRRELQGKEDLIFEEKERRSVHYKSFDNWNALFVVLPNLLDTWQAGIFCTGAMFSNNPISGIRLHNTQTSFRS